MPQYYPVVVQAGFNLAGDSLGFHAYSLRIDNCTNQWYLEETSLAYIPPYSLGVCLRLYGTGVAILLASAPIGQPQLAPIVGEQLVGTYSDQLRTEVAPAPIRQFTLVQSVSDLTQGAMPATPPVGVTRMWAAPNGDLHYLLPNGVDATLLSSTNYASYVGGSPLGGDLAGTVSNGTVHVRNNSSIGVYDTGGTLRTHVSFGTGTTWWAFQGGYAWVNQVNSVQWMTLDTSGNLTVQGGINAATGGLNVNTTINSYGGVYYFASNLTVYWQWDGTHIYTPNPILGNGSIIANGNLSANGGVVYFNSANTVYLQWNGSTLYSPNTHQVANLQIGPTGATANINYVSGGILQVQNQLNLVGALCAEGSARNDYGVSTPNNGGGVGQMLAFAFATYACVDHAVEYGLSYAPVSDPLTLVRPITGYAYDHVTMEAGDSNTPRLGEDGQLESTPTFGFRASEVNTVLPELAAGDSVDSSRLLAILWEAVKEVDARVSALEAA